MIRCEIKLDASAAEINANTAAMQSSKARLCFWVLLNQQITLSSQEQVRIEILIKENTYF